MKAKMTKAEIAKIKRQAKSRKNRRLSDGEFVRLMALHRPKEDDSGLSIIDINKENFTIPESILQNAGNLVTGGGPVRIKGPVFTDAKKTEDLKTKIEVEMKRFNDSYKKSKKSYRRMSNKQFKALMKKAVIELGINDDKGIEVIDIDAPSKHTNEDLIDLILQSATYTNGKTNIREEYKKAIRGHKLNWVDKHSILHYLLTDKTSPKPWCLLSKKEKTNEVRKVVKPRGDIKERPFRLIPDDEYVNEILQKKRIKMDYFDKSDLDSKIEWARYSNLVLNISSSVFTHIRITNKSDADIAMFAMKYACKMTKTPEFKGNFADPYWVILRTHKYCNHMTNREYDIFYKMAIDFLGIGQGKKTIPVIDASEAIEKLIPTLKANKTYKKYENKTKTDKSYNLRRIKSLILYKEEV